MKEISSYLFCLWKAVVFILPSSLYAQNLVMNPSFEDFIQCPTSANLINGSPDRISYASGWSSANLTGQYFHTCSPAGNLTTVPVNHGGYQSPATGDAYAGITYNPNRIYRAMICGRLNSPLTVGANYTVSMKVSAGEWSTRLVNKIGIDFSLTQLNCYWYGAPPSCASAIPSVPALYTDNVLADSTGWVTLHWNYTATSPSEYIVIGIFGDAVTEVVIRRPEDDGYAIVYVDDVSVVPGPDCSITVNTSSVNCHGGNDGAAEAIVDFGTGPFTYTWSPAPASGQGISQITGLTAQNYTVTVTNPSGSCTGTATVTQPFPLSLNVKKEDAHCAPNGSAVVTVQGGTGPYTYSWDQGASSSLNEISGLNAGMHLISVTDTMGCTKDLSFEILEGGLNTIIVTPQPAVIMEGGSVELTATGAAVYSWNPSESLSCTACPDPVATPLETTIYTVTGADTNGCYGTIPVTVTVNYNCPPIFVPTAFSPNGDGMNDDLLVYGGCIKRMVFEIYNRWGESVFKTDQVNKGWDGNFRGAPSAAGVYVYRLNADFKNGEKISLSGNVTLVR